MHEKPIEIIEPTPFPKNTRCKTVVYAIAGALTLGPLATALLCWYLFDLFFAAASFLIAYLVIGIIRAQMRNGTVPLSQQEYHYNDRAIAAWYVAKRLLCRDPSGA